MLCPKCGYKMAESDLDCPRCAKYAVAGGPSALPIEPTFPPPMRAVPSKVHIGAIIGMWLLAAATWVIVAIYTYALSGLSYKDGVITEITSVALLAVASEIISFIIAVWLVCQRSAADKSNGWVKIAYDIALFAITMISILSRAFSS